MYEHKCRDKEEADQNVNRNTNTGNAKQIEKVASAAIGQHDALGASLPAAPSSLSPRSSTPRPCKRSRPLTKQVPHLPQSPQAPAPCKSVNGSESARMGFRRCCWCHWHQNHSGVSVPHRLALTRRSMSVRCRPNLPAEREHAGQSSRGLDQGAREHLWRKDCFSESKDRGWQAWRNELPFSSKAFESLAKERIVFLRNAVWTHLNHLSQQCVTDDEVGRPPSGPAAAGSCKGPTALCVVQLYEEVRKSLEQCDVQKDIDHFVKLRRTGEKPAGRNARLVPVLLPGVSSTQTSTVSRSSSAALWELLQRSEISNSAASTAQQVRRPSPRRWSSINVCDSLLLNPNHLCVLWLSRRGVSPNQRNKSPGEFLGWMRKLFLPASIVCVYKSLKDEAVVSRFTSTPPLSPLTTHRLCRRGSRLLHSVWAWIQRHQLLRLRTFPCSRFIGLPAS